MDKKILGFTGTAEGMSYPQYYSLLTLVKGIMPDEFHHGMCQGADTKAHNCIRDYTPKAWIVGHPPINKSKFVFSECDEYREPKEYLERDEDIVTESNLLIATPLQDKEILRSGTWATVRYARKKGIDIWIIQRDGTIIPELCEQPLLGIKL